MKNKFIFLILLSVSFMFCQSLVTDIEKDSLGTISKISYYKDTKSGIKLTKEKYFFYNGINSKEINYNDAGQLHGRWISYYENGNKKIERQFYQGIEKTLNRYNEDGSIIKGYRPILGIWNLIEVKHFSHNVGREDSLVQANIIDSSNSRQGINYREIIEFREDDYSISYGTGSDEHLSKIVSKYYIRNNQIIDDRNFCYEFHSDSDEQIEDINFDYSINSDTLKIFINYYKCSSVSDIYQYFKDLKVEGIYLKQKK